MKKRSRGWVGVMAVIAGLSGCGDSGPAPITPADIPADGRPEGFEDMMKGMGDQMKKAGTNPGAASKANTEAASKANTDAAPKAP